MTMEADNVELRRKDEALEAGSGSSEQHQLNTSDVAVSYDVKSFFTRFLLKID